MKSTTFDLPTQRASLEKLFDLAERNSTDPVVIAYARKITRPCPSRDDQCELQAVYDWVKKNVRYVSDPARTDLFIAPAAMLRMYEKGAAQGDCDDFTSLIMALLGSIGWTVGARAWGPNRSEYKHVYPIAAYPKKDPDEDVGLDATVEEADVGWEPPGGAVLTAWPRD